MQPVVRLRPNLQPRRRPPQPRRKRMRRRPLRRFGSRRQRRRRRRQRRRLRLRQLPTLPTRRLPRQSDNISHIDIEDDHIDTIISHIDYHFPITMTHIPYRYPISISHIDIPYRYRIVLCRSVPRPRRGRRQRRPPGISLPRRQRRRRWWRLPRQSDKISLIEIVISHVDTNTVNFHIDTVLLMPASMRYHHPQYRYCHREVICRIDKVICFYVDRMSVSYLVTMPRLPTRRRRRRQRRRRQRRRKRPIRRLETRRRFSASAASVRMSRPRGRRRRRRRLSSRRRWRRIILTRVIPRNILKKHYNAAK